MGNFLGLLGFQAQVPTTDPGFDSRGVAGYRGLASEAPWHKVEAHLIPGAGSQPGGGTVSWMVREEAWVPTQGDGNCTSV